MGFEVFTAMKETSVYISMSAGDYGGSRLH
jgi:hypothetical protein